jgi:hypothetical protein
MFSRLLPLLALTGSVLLGLGQIEAAEPREVLYRNDFEAVDLDKAPKDFMVMSGGFAVKAVEGNRVLELPGAPLDTFAFLFGSSQQAGVSASARFLGAKQGRKYPTFGISLNGVGGYRLQVSPAKRALEIFKGDEPKAQVPFEWESGRWIQLRIQIRPLVPGGYVVEGSAWSGGEEPPVPMIRLEFVEALPPGRPGIWGSPYSGTAIQFDDLVVEALKPSL